MRRFHVPGARQETTQGISTHEKRRLLVLTVGASIVGIAILIGFLKSQQGDGSPVAGGDGPQFVETVVAPEIDRAALDALVEDDAPDERVVLESAGLDALQSIVRNITPGQYEALGLRELEERDRDALRADPSAARGSAYRVRGRVHELRTRSRAGGQEHIVRLQLETPPEAAEEYATLVARTIPTPLLEGDFVRMDGLFLKLFSDESHVESGVWLEGPLLVGREAVRSVAAFDQVDPSVFFDIQDDAVTADGPLPDPADSIPFTPLWNLMAFAQDVPEGAVDWESATVLDELALRELAENPAEQRLRPYRIPLKRIQDAYVRAAQENPARIERYTEGWLGDVTWSNVVRFFGPFEEYEAESADYVNARGFFFKNHAYVSHDRGLRTAPVFVLESLEVFTPEPAPIYGKIVNGIFIGTLIALAAFVALVTLSGKRSRALRQDVVRRRQERRRKRALQGQGSQA